MREFDFNATEEQLGLSEEQIAAMRKDAERGKYLELSIWKDFMLKLAKILGNIEDSLSDKDDANEEIQRKLDGIQKTLDEYLKPKAQSQAQRPA